MIERARIAPPNNRIERTTTDAPPGALPSGRQPELPARNPSRLRTDPSSGNTIAVAVTPVGTAAATAGLGTTGAASGGKTAIAAAPEHGGAPVEGVVEAVEVEGDVVVWAVVVVVVGAVVVVTVTVVGGRSAALAADAANGRTSATNTAARTGKR